MNTLITGSAGFIGSHLVERFLERGDTVVGVDNYLSGQRANTERFLHNPTFSFIEADASEGIHYRGPELDWVLHFGSPASPPHYLRHPVETLRAGAQATQAAMDLALHHGACFMLASTSEVYGDPQVHPQHEAYWGHVNPNGPRSCYDEAKRFAEALTFAYHRVHGLDVRVVRVFNTYGPHMRADDGRVVTNFVCQALRGQPITVYGDGTQTRSFQYIDDLVDGIECLMATPYHQPVNLGNPEEYSIRAFAEMVREIVDPDLEIAYRPLPVDDPSRRRPDIAVARRVLGWEPRVGLREGLARTVAVFRAQDVRAA